MAPSDVVTMKGYTPPPVKEKHWQLLLSKVLTAIWIDTEIIELYQADLYFK